MSWFGRDSPLRSSFSRKKYSFTPFQKEIHEGACLEVFRTHWQQAWSIMEKYGSFQPASGCMVDDINIVVNLLDQMTILLMQESQQRQLQLSSDNGVANCETPELEAVGPILGFFLSEGCLDKLFNWSTRTGEFQTAVKIEQLKLYEVLVTNCHHDILFHKPMVRPLLRLLASCNECSPVEVEKRLVILLNALCVSLTQCPELLQVFFRASSDQGATRSGNPRDITFLKTACLSLVDNMKWGLDTKTLFGLGWLWEKYLTAGDLVYQFLIFSLLIPFVHREGSIGQQARDALLLCMSLSRRNESIGTYIAEHSNFCPVLATGLSGLYSVLPRKLCVVSVDWHRLTTEDIAEMPELSLFLNSLEFCNAVIQVAHPMVQEQLLEYLYQGFLIPVLGPALHQSAYEEIITTTAYLELFLRTVTEPILLQVFLKFILTSSHDGHFILNTLIDRLGAQGQLCLVTMALFQQMLDINCEDVLFELVLRFLIPCSHIMVSQRSRIRDIDVYSSSADKFLALIPGCCHPNKPDSSESNQEGSPVSYPIVPGELSSLTIGERFSRGGSLRIKRHQRTSSAASLAFGELDKSLSMGDFQSYSIEAYQSSYLEYLKSAHESVKTCTLSCKSWSATYDGCDPSPESLKTPSTEVKNHDSETNNNKKPVILNGVCHAAHASRTKNHEKSKDVLLPSFNPSTTSMLPSNLEGTVSESSIISRSQLPNDMNMFNNHTKGITFSENKEILSQILCTDDENTFWSLIGSTKTPSSVSDLDDSLDTMDVCFKDAEPILKSSCEPPLEEKDEIGLKDEGSNLDSGVFESRESNSSSDRDGDNEPPMMTGAKLRGTRINSLNLNLLQKKECKSSVSHRESFGSPDVGPFLSILLTRLEMMMQNDVYTNLHLTGLLSRLAWYPQPLLRSFLLNHSLVFQPTVRSLLQVLGSLKHKVDSYSCTVDDFDMLVVKSRQFLFAREEYFYQRNAPKAYNQSLRKTRTLHDIQRGEPRRRSLTSLFFQRTNLLRRKSPLASKEPSLESIGDGQGYRYVTKPTPDALEGEMESVKTKNAVLCAVVLEEFLKELAAIAQEHALIQLDPDFWDKKWQLLI